MHTMIYDPTRRKWVEKNPEELIRQFLLRQMVEKLGYPPALIAIEKELSRFSHFKVKSNKEIPKRRADIIVFTKRDGELYPLIMIECKAVPLTPKFAQQVIGYNAFIEAPFVALANEHHVLTGRYDTEAGMYRFEKGLPEFNQLRLCVSTA